MGAIEGPKAAAGVEIRLARPTDAPAFAAIYAPIVATTVISFEETPPSEQDMERRIVTTLERMPWLAATAGGDVLGYAYASPHRARAAYRWSVDVSAYVHERARRRGVGRRLYEALLAILAHQGFRRAYAGIALPNDASVGLHRAVGFDVVGVYERVGWKFGGWHDVMWLGRSLELGETNGAPKEAVPLPEWLASPEGRTVAAAWL